MAQLVKNPPAMLETWVPSLGWEDPLEKGKTTHSRSLAWRIPWTRYSPWCCKESETTEQLSLFTPRAEGIQFGNEWKCSSLKWTDQASEFIWMDLSGLPCVGARQLLQAGSAGIYWRWRRAPGLPRS